MNMNFEWGGIEWCINIDAVLVDTEFGEGRLVTGKADIEWARWADDDEFLDLGEAEAVIRASRLHPGHDSFDNFVARKLRRKLSQ